MAVACIVLLWLAREIRVFSLRRADLPHRPTSLSHIAIFSAGYLLIDDINTGWLVLNIWHNLQYVLIVWMFNVNRFRKVSIRAGAFSRRSASRGTSSLYAFVCWALGTALYFNIDWALGAGLAQRPSAVAPGLHDDQLSPLCRRRDHLAPPRRAVIARLMQSAGR